MDAMKQELATRVMAALASYKAGLDSIDYFRKRYMKSARVSEEFAERCWQLYQLSEERLVDLREMQR
jgi:hypothetical protein